MIMTMTTSQAEWLRAPLQCAVVDALGADNIKFVGGAVRDTLIGREPSDIDAASPLLPDEVTSRLLAAGLKVFPTGIKHGTVTAALGKTVMEITTLRIDRETDGRHAEVAYTVDWLEDAKRRDFTFNAIYMAPDGRLFDPFNGLRDLEAGIVRFIGDAGQRIEEDALRILRYFRFYARYGAGDPDAEAITACAAKKAMLARLSIERVRGELLKLLSVADPGRSLGLLLRTGVLEALIGAKACLESCMHFIEQEKAVSAPINTLARFYFLTNSAMTAPQMAKHFKFSLQQRKRLLKMATACALPPISNPADARRALYELGSEAVEAALLSQGAGLETPELQIARNWPVPIFPLRGKDMIDAGLQPGPEIGERLRILESRWIASDFALTKAELLSR